MQDMCPHPSLPLPKSLLQTPAPAPDHKLTLNRNWEAYMRAIVGGICLVTTLYAGVQWTAASESDIQGPQDPWITTQNWPMEQTSLSH